MKWKGGERNERQVNARAATLKYTIQIQPKSIQIYKCQLQKPDLWKNMRVGIYQTQFVQFCLEGL